MKRQNAVLLLIVSFAFVVLAMTSVVMISLQTIAARSDALDENRSRQTVSGALSTLRQQMATTIHDYAMWDDAARTVYGPDPHDWIVENFGLADMSSGLFDIAYVLSPDDGVVIAYRDSKPFSMATGDVFSADFKTMVDRVRAAGYGPKADMTQFMRTRFGVAVVGISAIRPASEDMAMPVGDPQLLVFVRHLDAEKVRQIGETYVVHGLRLVGDDRPDMASAAIAGIDGHPIAHLVWTSLAPGDVSYHQVRPYVLAAIGAAGTFSLLLILAGARIIAKLGEDERTARRLAMTDRLSGLKNRACLFLQLEIMIEQGRLRQRDVVLFYLDMDGFKEVNDVYGHPTGDQLIRSVSAGMTHLVPTTAILARLGGDEFAIALDVAQHDTTASALAAMIVEFFAQPFVLGERVVNVGASLGKAVSPSGSINADELLRRADIAMYRAKSEGKGRVASYSPEMDKDLNERKAMEAALRLGLDDGECSAVYQPIVDARSRRIVGVEALVRWQSHAFGLVSPETFIPVAEAAGLIDGIGQLVLGEALKLGRRFPHLSLSINISQTQFRNAQFIPGIARQLLSSGVDASRVTLEVTEGFLIAHPERARGTLEALKSIGLRIALDDFGAGFSSIGYLRQFRFDRLKLDRSLIASIEDLPQARSLLKATLALAASLGIPVTAEGIETDDQAKIAANAGCGQLQGFLFSRPVDEEDLARLIHAEHNRDHLQAS